MKVVKPKQYLPHSKYPYSCTVIKFLCGKLVFALVFGFLFPKQF